VSEWEGFSGDRGGAGLQWHCPPPHWEVDATEGSLSLETGADTDFWQRTHYGFRADNGHFLYTVLKGDFEMQTQVRFQPVHQYDQAGLMVRLSEDCWLKTSVEHEPDRADQLGAVVTNGGYSDWSMQDMEECAAFWLQVRREGPDYFVAASRDGNAWSPLRVARLHEDDGQGPVQCGLYACSPKGAGFTPRFQFLRIQQLGD
jgi:uncharacterized protein